MRLSREERPRLFVGFDEQIRRVQVLKRHDPGTVLFAMMTAAERYRLAQIMPARPAAHDMRGLGWARLLARIAHHARLSA